MEFDPAAIGILVLHAAHAVQAWVSMVCSGDVPSRPAASLLTFAYERAADVVPMLQVVWRLLPRLRASRSRSVRTP